MRIALKPLHVGLIVGVVAIGIAFLVRGYVGRPTPPMAPQPAASQEAEREQAPSSAGQPVLPAQPLASSGAPLQVIKLTDNNPQTWWSSAERGEEVKGTAWIGARFADATPVAAVRLRQTWNKPFRQDAVRVQYSLDGSTWQDALPDSVATIADETVIPIPNPPAAQWWRVVAAADNAAMAPDANWTPLDVFFFAAE